MRPCPCGSKMHLDTLRWLRLRLLLRLLLFLLRRAALVRASGPGYHSWRVSQSVSFESFYHRFPLAPAPLVRDKLDVSKHIFQVIRRRLLLLTKYPLRPILGASRPSDSRGRAARASRNAASFLTEPDEGLTQADTARALARAGGDRECRDDHPQSRPNICRDRFGTSIFNMDVS